jgi:hypothetical protein
MRTAAVLMSAAALVFSATELSAQAKPSFAAKWTMVADPNAPAPTAGRGGRSGLGPEATITQDDKTLTLTRTTPNGEMKSVYNLDGTDSKNTMSFGGNSIDQISKVKWDGAKLVITTSSSFNGNAFETTMALSLDAAGNLVVDSTAPGRGGGAPTTTKTTYKKS